MKSSNYNNLFVSPFENAQEIDKKVINLLFNKKSEGLLNYLRKEGCNYLYLDDFMIMQAIHKFTFKDIAKSELEESIDCVRNQEDVHFVKILKDERYQISKMVIERDDVTIEVIPFSKLFANSLKSIPELENTDREGKCIDMVTNIVDKLGIKNEIVTGYIYGTTDKSKFLHSWIETKLGGEEVVIDGVFNAIFNKDGYYALTKALKKQKIRNEDYKKDVGDYLINLEGCIDNIPVETYLYFRDEIMKDIKNNEFVFNNCKR